MERTKLVAARAHRHWTLAQAAEHLQVDINTLYRWEQGKATPRMYNLQRLCEVYGVTAPELDLNDDDVVDVQHIPSSNVPNDRRDETLRARVEQDLTLHFLKVILSWPPHNTQYYELQAQIKQVTEEFCAMNDSPDERISRRDAFQRLALMPIKLYSLSTGSAVLVHSSIEEVLTQCATGITACEYLSNSADLAVAFSAVSAYVPMLIAIVKTSSLYRRAAARLASQCLFLKTILGMHLEGISQAMCYAQQAVEYSEESGDIPLRITALGRLAWVYSCKKQRKPALEKALQASSLLEKSRSPLPSDVQSYVYGVLAKYQAFNGLKEEASRTLQQARETFFTADQKAENARYAYMDHDLSNFLLDDGVTQIFMGHYEEALQSFAQIINPNDLSARIPLAERIRVEVLNYQALASLKSVHKDMEQTTQLWQAAIQGATAIQSEQRFTEACATFEIMECVWSGDKRIDTLRDLTLHW